MLKGEGGGRRGGEGRGRGGEIGCSLAASRVPPSISKAHRVDGLSIRLPRDA